MLKSVEMTLRNVKKGYYFSSKKGSKKFHDFVKIC